MTLSVVVLPVPVPAAHQDVQPAFDAGFEEIAGPLGKGLELDEILSRVGLGRELPDGERSAPHRDRGQDDVDAGAIGKTSVDIGGRLVDPPPYLAHDLLDDPVEVAVIPETLVRLEELAAALDVDIAIAVDHDLGDGRVAQELLDRTVPEHLGHQLIHHLLAFGPGHRGVLGGQSFFDLGPHHASEFRLRERLVVEPRAQFLNDI